MVGYPGGGFHTGHKPNLDVKIATNVTKKKKLRKRISRVKPPSNSDQLAHWRLAGLVWCGISPLEQVGNPGAWRQLYNSQPSLVPCQPNSSNASYTPLGKIPPAEAGLGV